jgi:hypothetical protein
VKSMESPCFSTSLRRRPALIAIPIGCNSQKQPRRRGGQEGGPFRAAVHPSLRVGREPCNRQCTKPDVTPGAILTTDQVTSFTSSAVAPLHPSCVLQIGRWRWLVSCSLLARPFPACPIGECHAFCGAWRFARSFELLSRILPSRLLSKFLAMC